MPQVDSYVTQNYRKSAETSNLGTRKLAFYTFSCDAEYGMVGPYTYGYSFRVNTSTGEVTVTTPGQHISEVADGDYDDDLIGNFGNTDDDTASLPTAFDLTFLSNSSIDTLWVDTNSVLYFGSPSNDSRNGPNDPTFDGNNVPAMAIANNDGSITALLVQTTGTAGTREFRLKFRGNTDYTNDPSVNLVWEVLFHEDAPEHFDVLVSHQPSNWAEYNDSQGDVAWGVSNGSIWIDGRSNHSVSFADPSRVGGDAWKENDSLYYQVVRALQEAGAEFYWLGEPHNGSENFIEDWSGLNDPSRDAFTFAIKDDAANPYAFYDYDTYDVLFVNDYDPNFITISGNHTFYRGQPVKFNTAAGGLTANQMYYIINSYQAGGNTHFTVTDRFDRTPFDIELPDLVGGIPLGDALTLTNDLDGGTIATMYYYGYSWEGTSNDSSSNCCNEYFVPIIGSVNFWFALQNVPFFSNNTSYNFDRAQATFGIFPAYWVL